jgi:hypothetical protein
VGDMVQVNVQMWHRCGAQQARDTARDRQLWSYCGAVGRWQRGWSVCAFTLPRLRCMCVRCVCCPFPTCSDLRWGTQPECSQRQTRGQRPEIRLQSARGSGRSNTIDFPPGSGIPYDHMYPIVDMLSMSYMSNTRTEPWTPDKKRRVKNRKWKMDIYTELLLYSVLDLSYYRIYPIELSVKCSR